MTTLNITPRFSLIEATSFISHVKNPDNIIRIIELEKVLIQLADQISKIVEKADKTLADLQSHSHSDDPNIFYGGGAVPYTQEGWAILSAFSSLTSPALDSKGSKVWSFEQLPSPEQLFHLKNILSHYLLNSKDQEIIKYCSETFRIINWFESQETIKNLYQKQVTKVIKESSTLVVREADSCGEDLGRLIPVWAELYTLIYNTKKFHCESGQHLIKIALKEGYLDRQDQIIAAIQEQKAIHRAQLKNARKSAEEIAAWIARSVKEKKPKRKKLVPTTPVRTAPTPPSTTPSASPPSPETKSPSLLDQSPESPNIGSLQLFDVTSESTENEGPIKSTHPMIGRISTIKYQTRVTRWAKVKNLEDILTFEGYENSDPANLPSILKAHFFPGVERLLKDLKFKDRYSNPTKEGKGCSLSGILDGVPVIITITFDKKGRVYHKYAQPVKNNSEWGRGLLYLFDQQQIKIEDTFARVETDPNSILYENERFIYNQNTGTFSIEDSFTNSTLTLNPLHPEVAL
jgi:hypothetical protein